MSERCVICGRVKGAWQQVGTEAFCTCNLGIHTTAYPIAVIRPDQYQEIIDRLERIERLVNAKHDKPAIA